MANKYSEGRLAPQPKRHAIDSVLGHPFASWWRNLMITEEQYFIHRARSFARLSQNIGSGRAETSHYSTRLCHVIKSPSRRVSSWLGSETVSAAEQHKLRITLTESFTIKLKFLYASASFHLKRGYNYQYL